MQIETKPPEGTPATTPSRKKGVKNPTPLFPEAVRTQRYGDPYWTWSRMLLDKLAKNRNWLDAEARTTRSLSEVLFPGLAGHHQEYLFSRTLERNMVPLGYVKVRNEDREPTWVHCPEFYKDMEEKVSDAPVLLTLIDPRDPFWDVRIVPMEEIQAVRK